MKATRIREMSLPNGMLISSISEEFIK